MHERAHTYTNVRTDKTFSRTRTHVRIRTHARTYFAQLQLKARVFELSPRDELAVIAGTRPSVGAGIIEGFFFIGGGGTPHAHAYHGMHLLMYILMLIRTMV